MVLLHLIEEKIESKALSMTCSRTWIGFVGFLTYSYTEYE